MQIHAIEVGRMTGNETFLRGASWGSLLRPATTLAFPVFAFAIEHADGLLLVDAGPNQSTTVPRPMRRIASVPEQPDDRRLGPALAATGLNVADVSEVVLTHLDYDHVGGIADVAHADARVHAPELAFATSRAGRLRTQSQRWPASFQPSTFTLDDGPVGPFEQSKALTADGSICAVALPGHTPGQIGIAIDEGNHTVLLCADHVLNERWLLDDLRAGRRLGLGIFGATAARATTDALEALLCERDVVLLPSHDDETPSRLAARRPTRLDRAQQRPT